MTITLGPELARVPSEEARREGVAPGTRVVDALRERFLGSDTVLEPRDEWERGLLEAARDCGVSLSDEAPSSEGLYAERLPWEP